MSETDNPSTGHTGHLLTLALSGGGARAIAFHLGCLRGLHDRKLLEKVQVVSTVSGGSVIGACLAYWDVDFDEFERRIVKLLRKGIQRSIMRSVLFSYETPKIIFTLLCTAIPTFLIGLVRLALRNIRLCIGFPTNSIEGWLASLSRSLPIWGSLTTAFENALHRELFGDTKLADVKRPGWEVVINACDLRTGTAFRFGSRNSGGWRYGRIKNNDIPVAKAVAASAAFPLLLPPLIEYFRFERDGGATTDRVVLTDGGIFDNLGVTVLEPGRDSGISVNTYFASHIISLNAGPGQASGETSPYWWVSRVMQSFDTVHRKVQDNTYARLHRYVESGQLKGFGMVYLGQDDRRLPYRPTDLVSRNDVRDYPTDFAPMREKDLDALSLRGKQLTQLIVDRYLSDL